MNFHASLQAIAFTTALALHTAANPARAAAPPPPAGAAQTGITLPAPAQGAAAIAALGDRLPDVAAAYGLKAEELQELFRRDHTLWADRNGKLLYADDHLPNPGAEAAEPIITSSPITTTFPLADTFKLHSRPGAKRVIYLDFDGHVLSNTAWNSSNGGNNITCPPWDIEGGALVFTDRERGIIQGVWRRVAEDFLPFDVDVTTEFPGDAAMTRTGSTDEFYGMRVLISPISSYFGNYGGIAYVGVFNAVGDYYKPALVFPENLANAEKYIAEACSHETGHTVGLNHDGATSGVSYYQGHGSGETGWAPIMGNSYYKNLTQWSKGEYPNANNQQDDLAVMQNYGLPARIDDYGNSASNASFLPTGSQVTAVGEAGLNNDVDAIGFITESGPISLLLAPTAPGANLDIRASLYNTAGQLLAVGNPTDLLSARIDLEVSAGTYYLLIDGAGKGDLLTGYSKYASLGGYTLTANLIDATGQVDPVAVAAANPTSGTAPLAVQFDGSDSFDLDGTIVQYSWNFADGASSSAMNPAHTFTAIGVYPVTLTVTDNLGNTHASAVTVTALPPNTSPVAILSANPTAGYSPLTVQFSGAASYDPDGSIASYQWNFGDGATATGATVQHTYNTVGTFTAALVVTDNRGATAQTSAAIQTQQDPNLAVRVQSITLAAATSGNNKIVRATVKVTNLAGAAAPGIQVTGAWTGAVSGTSSGITGADGNAVLSSGRIRKTGTATFTITGLSAAGYTYLPANNLVNSASLPVTR